MPITLDTCNYKLLLWKRREAYLVFYLCYLDPVSTSESTNTNNAQIRGGIHVDLAGTQNIIILWITMDYARAIMNLVMIMSTAAAKSGESF